MAHRGRLNVLANVMSKSAHIFREFEDQDPSSNQGAGDVKYHLASVPVRRTAGRRSTSRSLQPEPPRVVNPVALGRMRAKQDAGRRKGEQGMRVPDSRRRRLRGEGDRAGDPEHEQLLRLPTVARSTSS
jgi:2-oxoglutarate dehydrogenase E1 component